MSAAIFILASIGCCITRRRRRRRRIATHPSADHAHYVLKAERDWTKVTIHVFHISHWWKMEKSYC